MAIDKEAQSGPLRHMRGYCPETKTWVSIRVNDVGEIVIDPIDTEKIADGAVTSAKMTIEWTDWTPTYSAVAPMTYTSVTTYIAKYCIIDKILFFQASFSGTTGGTASKTIRFTLPIAIADDTVGYIGGGCSCVDIGLKAGQWFNYDANTVGVKNYVDVNWNLGVDKRVRIQGFYRIA